MTIRKKFFLLAGILLGLFGAVGGVLAFAQKLDRDQLGNINEYELPLLRLVADFDVDTDRYELEVMRALLSDKSDPQGEISSAKKLADQLRKTVAAGGAVLQKATRDPAYETEDRVELARMAGVLRYLSRNLEGVHLRRRGYTFCAHRWTARGCPFCGAWLCQVLAGVWPRPLANPQRSF